MRNRVSILFQRFHQGLLAGWTDLFRGRTLSRRILGPIIPAIFLVTFFFGAFTYQLVKKPIVANVRHLVSSEAQNTARALEVFFQQRFSDLDALAESPLLLDFARARRDGRLAVAETQRKALERTLTHFADRARVEGDRVYRDIGYFDASGRRLFTLLREDGELSRADFPPEFFAHLRRGRPFDPPVQRAAPEGPLLKRFAKASFDESGQFLGVLVLDCDLTAVANILRDVRVGKLGTAYIQDAAGRNVLDLPIARARSVVRAEQPIRETETNWYWRVVVEAPEKEFLERPLWQSLWVTMLLSVVATFFLALVIVSRVSDLMGPIKSLVEGTKRFASGDMTFRFTTLKSVEMDVLAGSFNQMAETLEIRNRELEQRLRQLTALKDMEEAVIRRQDEESVLRLCIEAVARGFAFDRVGLYWVDNAHKEVVGRFLFGSDTAGFSESAFKKRRVPIGGDDILNDVLRTRTAVIVRNPENDPRANRLFINEAPAREFAMAPICGKERSLGLLIVDNAATGRPLSDADREALTLYTNAVGLALENAGLFQNLADSESKLRTLLENSPEAIIGLSREHWISTWNRGAEKIFGFTSTEALGKPLTILFPKSSGLEFKRLLNNVMEKGAVRDFSMPGQAKDGRALELSVSWGGQHADFWMNKEWTLVLRDVTESRRLQQQLIRSEKLSAVGQLISGIAHELNNPLQAVVGYSDILGDDVRQKAEANPAGPVTLESKEVLNDLRIITENAMRCQKIIENLLLFVRQGEIEKRPVDLAKVVQASRDLLQYKLKKAAHVEVEVDIPERCPHARGNFQQIQQVFVNLINNACDAMAAFPDRPKRLRITVRETAARTLRIEIADSGPGVPEGVRDRVFEPFFTTKAEGRGTGLGLPVCRQIIEDHGGRIGFSTEPQQGTTFWFELPLANEDLIGVAPAEPTLPPVRGRTILLVDDEPDVLGFLTKVVQGEGNTVEVAGSLRDAITRAARRPYDLVITDIRLGEGTGFSLYENWSLWSAHPQPPFLFMTGDVLNGAVTADIEKRGLHLLHKPIDLPTFQNTLRKALGTVPPPLNTPSTKS